MGYNQKCQQEMTQNLAAKYFRERMIKLKSFKKILVKNLKKAAKILTNQIIKGDCEKILKLIPTGSIKAVVMDGPYVLHTRKGKNTGCYAHTDYIKGIAPFCEGFSVNILKEIVRICEKINGIFFCSAAQLDFYISFFQQYDNVEIILHTWQKTNPLCAKGTMLCDTEYIVQVVDKSLLDEVDTTPEHFISPKYTKLKKKYGHGTIKPVEIMTKLIEKVSEPGDLILDPFCGTNSTGVSALMCGRDFIGCEIEDEYAKVSEQRIIETMEELGIEDLAHNELCGSVALGNAEEILETVEKDEFDVAFVDSTAFADVPFTYIDSVIAKMTSPCVNVWVEEKDIIDVSMRYARQGFIFDIVYSYGEKTMAMVHLRKPGKLFYGTYHTSRHFYVDDGMPYQPKSKKAKKVLVEQSVGSYDDSIPYMVMRNMVLNCTQIGDTVLDLTSGGLVAEICTRTDRKFLCAVQNKEDLLRCTERISKAKALKGGEAFDMNKVLTFQD